MQRRVVTGVWMGQFARQLEEWDWREVRALGVEENWVCFGNKFWDMYNIPSGKGKEEGCGEAVVG